MFGVFHYYICVYMLLFYLPAPIFLVSPLPTTVPSRVLSGPSMPSYCTCLLQTVMRELVVVVVTEYGCQRRGVVSRQAEVGVAAAAGVYRSRRGDWGEMMV